MAKVHGRRSFFNLTDSAAVVQNISQWITNLDFPAQVDTAEVSGFGDSAKSYVVGLKSRNIRLQGNFANDANNPDVVFSGLEAGGANGTLKTTFIYGPNGSVTGEIRYTGSAWCTSYGITSPIGGAVTWSADLQVDGAITRNTFT